MVTAARLRRTADIALARTEGVTHRDRLFTARARRTDTGLVRLAVSSQRALGSAVARNRARRRLREAFRLELGSRPTIAGIDLVLAGRPPVLSASWGSVRAAASSEIDLLLGGVGG